MALDTKEYPIYSYPLNSVTYFGADSLDARNFFRDLYDGTIGGFSISGLFQNSADYVISARYYPFRIFKFYNYDT